MRIHHSNDGNEECPAVPWHGIFTLFYLPHAGPVRCQEGKATLHHEPRERGSGDKTPFPATVAMAGKHVNNCFACKGSLACNRLQNRPPLLFFKEKIGKTDPSVHIRQVTQRGRRRQASRGRGQGHLIRNWVFPECGMVDFAVRSSCVVVCGVLCDLLPPGLLVSLAVLFLVYAPVNTQQSESGRWGTGKYDQSVPVRSNTVQYSAWNDIPCRATLVSCH